VLISTIFQDGLSLKTTEKLTREALLSCSALLMLQNQHIKEELQKRSTQIVSLGEDCLSRTLPTRWRLKPRKAEGELTYPFDLAVHSVDSIIQLLDNDFKFYTDKRFLRLAQNKIIVNSKYGVTFNHESGDSFAQNDYSLLVEVVNRRVANFRDLAIREGSLIFIIHTRRNSSMSAESLQDLANILENYFTGKSFSIIVIDTREEALSLSLKNDLFSIIRAPYPTSGYIWHNPSHFNRFDGIIYEISLMVRLSEVLRSVIGLGSFTNQ